MNYCIFMETKHIYWCRHCETLANEQGIWSGVFGNPGLTKKGILQAEKLCASLTPFEFEAIVSSDMRRARETAYTVNRHRKITHFVDPRLQECNFGAAEGMLASDVWLHFPAEASLWLAPQVEEYDVSFPRGEYQSAALKRAFECLDELMLLHSQKSFMIVSHGGVSGLVLNKLGASKAWLNNGEFAHIIYEKGRYSVVE